MRSICLIFFLLLTASTALAVKAPPAPITVRQPDGKVITLYISGDEFARRIVAADGRTMEKGRDGFFRPAQERRPGPVVLRRQSSLSMPALKSASAASLPTDVRALLLPVRFEGTAFSVEDQANHFDELLNSTGYSANGGTGSAKDYFEANMPGHTFTFDV